MTSVLEIVKRSIKLHTYSKKKIQNVGINHTIFHFVVILLTLKSIIILGVNVSYIFNNNTLKVKY